MGVIGVTAEGRITAANHAAAELLGVTAAELLAGGTERLPTAIRAGLDDALAGHPLASANWRAPDGREAVFSCRREGEKAAVVILTPL